MLKSSGSRHSSGRTLTSGVFFGRPGLARHMGLRSSRARLVRLVMSASARCSLWEKDCRVSVQSPGGWVGELRRR